MVDNKDIIFMWHLTHKSMWSTYVNNATMLLQGERRVTSNTLQSQKWKAVNPVTGINCLYHNAICGHTWSAHTTGHRVQHVLPL